MTAGFNVLVDITTFSYLEDDTVGGAVPTGTVLVERVPARFEALPQTLALLEQGLESPLFYKITLSYAGRRILENDAITIRAPQTHRFFGKDFRVVSVNLPSFMADDPRNYLVLLCRRKEESHGPSAY